MTIRFADFRDIDGWMELVDRVKDGFPGLETKEAMAEHRNTVLRFISSRSAICAETGGVIAGILLFSREDGTLCFLAVDENRRRQRIGEGMVRYMLEAMPRGREVAVTTYREEAAEGKAARAFYRSLGFAEGELCEEFGSRVQKFVLRRD